jgi:hypothetical protein
VISINFPDPPKPSTRCLTRLPVTDISPIIIIKSILWFDDNDLKKEIVPSSMRMVHADAADNVLHQFCRDVRDNPILNDDRHHNHGMDPSFRRLENADATTTP